MKDDGFHRTKTKPNEKLLLLKLKNGKTYAKHLLFTNYADFTGKGYFGSNRNCGAYVKLSRMEC